MFISLAATNMELEVSGWTYFTFALYLIGLIGVGLCFVKKSSENLENYILGGRSLGSWVTALSAQASDMSGWLLMGLPGAVYLSGLCNAWVAIGLLIGTFLNWVLVAPRLRIYTEQTNSLTINDFINRRFQTPKNLIRICGALITLLFFTIYTASGLVAAGKLFESMFHIDYLVAVCSGAAVMIIYTLLGGFLAVCWTDFVQGMLMFFAIIILPLYVVFTKLDKSIVDAYAAKDIALTLIPDASSPLLAIVAIISMSAWGLGYFGQPHILTRFMGIKSAKLFPRATTIAMIWVVISLACSVWIGLIARAVFTDLNAAEAENAFIYLINLAFHPLPAGILLAAILAAIMSTIDSQLLVSSASLTDDIYLKVFRPKAKDKEQILVNRSAVVVIMIVACALAANRDNSIFSLVQFAWSGFGATFGPAILFAIYSRKSSWYAIFSGMIVGSVVLLVWYKLGYGKYMYEIVPGFIANFLTIYIVNFISPNRNKSVEEEFDIMKQKLKAISTEK